MSGFDLAELARLFEFGAKAATAASHVEQGRMPPELAIVIDVLREARAFGVLAILGSNTPAQTTLLEAAEREQARRLKAACVRFAALVGPEK